MPTTVASWSHQQPIELDSSSPPVPSSPPRVSLSPYRFKPARSFDLPLHSSSPPRPAFSLPKKQPVLRAGSRAEPIPDGAVAGFRSAKELAAELRHPTPDSLGKSKSKKENSTDRDDGSKTTRKSKKRKSDESDIQSEAHDSATAAGRREGKLRCIKKPEPVTLDSSSPGISSHYFAEPKTSKKPPPPRKQQNQGHVETPSAQVEIAKHTTTKTCTKDLQAQSSNKQIPISEDQIQQASLNTASPHFSEAALPLPQDKARLSLDNHTHPRQTSAADTSNISSVHKEQTKQIPPPTTKQDIEQQEKKEVPSLAAKTAPGRPKSKASPVKKPDTSPKPAKAPAKSSRTVTGIVLAQFKPPSEPPEPTTAPAYTAQQLLGLESFNGDGNPKKKKKRTSAKSRTKAVTPIRLFSPEDVEKRVRAQDTMFGTSSQLATEDSPRTVRLLQQAYRESEAAIVDLTTPLQLSRVSSAAGTSRGLWSVGTRGDDDFMFTPEPFPQQPALVQQDDSFEDIDIIAATNTTEAATTDSTPQTQTQEPSFQLRLSKSAKSSAPRMRLANASSFVMPMPPSTVSSAALSTTSASRLSPSRPPLQALEPQSIPPQSIQPEFIKPQTAEPKPRGRPRQNAAVQTDAAPKKPRGRPRKDADDTSAALAAATKSKSKSKPRQPANLNPHNSDDFVAIEDAIFDPDPPPTPSPPRRRAAPAAALPLDLSTVDSTDAAESRQPDPKKDKNTSKPAANLRKAAADPDNAARMTLLFPLITTAVKTAPRGTQASPSWWEKMLLYDPIVLEDFAHWLNTTALPLLTSEDEQMQLLPVPAWMVQRWCEEHSVCCLWRQGLRGGVRARY